MTKKSRLLSIMVLVILVMGMSFLAHADEFFDITSPFEKAMMLANERFVDLYPGVPAEDLAKIQIKSVYTTNYQPDSLY